MTPRTDSRRRRYKVRTVVLASAATCASVIGATSAAPAAATGHGHVPWNHLSRGWTMALWTMKGDSTATVYLVGPRGKTYPITAVTRQAYPDASSPDGKTVLLSGRRGEIRLDLRTGHRTTIKLPPGIVVGFTHDGRSLLEAVSRRRGGLERFGLDGHHELNYPVRTRGAGYIDPYQILALPGGRLVTGASHGVVVLRHNGTVAKRLARNLRSCSVVSRWDKGVALARCGRGVLWAVPIAGGPVTRLTDGTSKENPFGYTNEWRYSGGRLGLAANGCGPDTLVRFNQNGHGHRITVPAPIGRAGTPVHISHHGNVVDMIWTSGCEPIRPVLFAYNAVTNTSRVLLGGPVNGGKVTAAIPLGS